MPRVRDKFWLWGHPAGSHNGQFGVNAESSITPVEAAVFLRVPNLIMVRYGGRPAPPFEEEAAAVESVREVVWSLIGAGGATDEAEREAVFDLLARRTNITGVILDDFFRTCPDQPEFASLTPRQLRDIRTRLWDIRSGLDLWVVLYTYQLNLELGRYLDQCDKVTLWTWKARDLDQLEDHFSVLEWLAPSCDRFLGCYMWDYGDQQPMPRELMRMQCELGLRWLRSGRIDGMIFLASCICDLGLPAVEWTRQWIAEVGDEELDY